MRSMQERGQAANSVSSAPTFLQADEFAARGLLAWWYRAFAPHPPVGRLVTLREREQIRRGRLASILLAVQLLFIELPVIPVVMTAPNSHIVLPWLLGCIAILLAAFVLNRRGQLTVAGVLMVASIEVTVCIKIITVPGGISVFYLPQFDILIQPILIAVALLEPWSAFAVAGFNCCFIVTALMVGPHAPDLSMALRNPTQVGDLFAVPIMSQVLASFFAWLIVKNLLEALKQADRAEQIAALEFSLAESRRKAEERNMQLEAGLHGIVQSIRQVSQGQLTARIHLPTENVLWPMSQQINLFIERYQGAREAEAKLLALQHAIAWCSNEIYEANRHMRPVKIQRTNTALDGVLMALATGQKSEGSLPNTRNIPGRNTTSS
jgi:hypothetical protein